MAEVKNYIKLDADLVMDDAQITSFIRAARKYAEHFCSSSFISQGWRLVLDAFPGGNNFNIIGTCEYCLPSNAILLEHGPVLSVTSITYLAMDGSTQTMAAGSYIADLSGKIARITPVFGKIWPIPMMQIASVSVNYIAGLDLAADPYALEGIRDWILTRVKSRNDMRGHVAIAGRGKIESLPWDAAMLDPYRIIMA